ncbi:rCG33189, partial [Rattus norvegicus]
MTFGLYGHQAFMQAKHSYHTYKVNKSKKKNLKIL